MIHYEIDTERRLVLANMSGGNDMSDLIGYVANLSADPKFDSRFNSLLRIGDDATLPSLSADSLLKNFLEAWEQKRKGAKWAVVTSSQTQLSLARLAASNINLKHVQLQFFENEHHALGWLETGDAANTQSTSG